MTLRLVDKKALVAEVNEVASTALSAIAAIYRGMTVAQMTDLRAKAMVSGRIWRTAEFRATRSTRLVSALTHLSQCDRNLRSRLMRQRRRSRYKCPATQRSRDAHGVSSRYASGYSYRFFTTDRALPVAGGDRVSTHSGVARRV